MQGIYIATYDLKNAGSGVSKKINAQISALKTAGMEVEVLDATAVDLPKSSKIKSLVGAVLGTYRGKLHALLELAIKKIEDGGQYDFLYIRKGLLDMEQVRSLRRIKELSSKTRILLEIPTYPYDGEIRFYDYPFLCRDRQARRQLCGCVDRIVTYSEDEGIFGVPTIQIHNGADYQNTAVRACTEHAGIHLIAVALFDSWHGYDRVIQGMKNDLALVKQNDLHLLLVGSGRAIPGYKKLVERYGLSEYVHFLGLKSGDELKELYDISDIGLDAMGRHRGGVYYNSTLKGKEYCARGIPSISGVRTELDAEKDFPYYLRVPADDSPVSVSDILEFYHRIYDGRQPVTVACEIRDITAEKFDMNNVFTPVITYLQGDQ